jgi:hypothetical protein
MIWLAEFVSTVQLTKLPFRSKVCLIQKLFLFHFFGLVSKQQASVFHLSLFYLFFFFVSLYFYVYISVSLLNCFLLVFYVSLFFIYSFGLRHSVSFLSAGLLLADVALFFSFLSLSLCISFLSLISFYVSFFLDFVMGDWRKNQVTQIQTKTNIFRRYL